MHLQEKNMRSFQSKGMKSGIVEEGVSYRTTQLLFS